MFVQTTEWDPAVFDAIQVATANRFTVVEAAGNYNIDLDQADCLDRFDRSVRDSGAIIVGAGEPSTWPNPRSKLGFSTYGSRVDVQGYGQGVTTTAYGNLFSDGPNNSRDYTDTFGGTSSASPIVASAAAALQGIAKDLFGTPLLPFQLRKVRKTPFESLIGLVMSPHSCAFNLLDLVRYRNSTNW